MTATTTTPLGAPVDRVEGADKVRGLARYSFEHPVDRPVYLHPLQADVAAGRVVAIDSSAALAEPGVVGVLTHHNAPGVASADDQELAILQSGEVAFRGQFIGGVLAETPEVARYAAGLVHVEYQRREHDTRLSADRTDLYKPDAVNGGFTTDTAQGDLDRAMTDAAVTHEAVYTTPLEHNNPLEPHTTIACWEGDDLTLYDSTQGVHWVRDAICAVFGMDPEHVHVVCPHVGGGFGSKGQPHAPTVLAAMAARLVTPRPVKLALTRQQMFSLAGYRTGTIQRIQLGADPAGSLTAIGHDVVEQTSRIKEFAEQTAVPSRMFYAAPNRRSTHRIAALDVPVPSWMRAPGECPGTHALEVAMDEMALACGMDPIEFRVRNDPRTDPETGLPFSSRNLEACLREGARRFGWDDRDPTPGARRDGEWLVGTGVAASSYPVLPHGGSQAAIRVGPDGRYRVRVGAADIGTGAWTALTQIAADALGVGLDDVVLSIGDTDLPYASGAGGSTGTMSWGSAIVDAARRLRDELPAGGPVPDEGIEVVGQVPDNPYRDQYAMHAFGAQFAEVRVHAMTGEIRVPRLFGMFAVGRMMNAKTGRSQLIGGMTMGMSMALHEHSYLDPVQGHVVNHDLAEYHIAANADVGSVDADWIDEDDPYVNALGAKGIGEIGIVGTAAAVVNAAWHATGVRVRDLPITLDKFL
ncbi:xanthine dehydrogenase family protein molybdopterin-binding subunit [Saccharopolyspora cebuensis]|uniref:Xanthine dehydrogenase family protein molybdopterin-binding subunit n=1 Tax=Saccharopolyspora cebuensis TaxID=418759 RepID=A0ABV4CKF6_9PSEU